MSKGEVVSGATIGDLDPLRQERWASTKTKRLTVCRCWRNTRSRSALEQPSGCGRDRLARFADELGGAFVEADHGPLRVKLLGIEVEHILHAGDVGRRGALDGYSRS